ncbi:MAG: hypothetical protein IJB97_07965, partial [Clostridia bacterium]|nr:hypothetical protein [Clostridia bacterium]
MEKNVCIDGRKVEDVLRGLENGRFAYTGEMGRSIDFIKSAQLGDRRLWQKFVNQFRIRADAKNDGWSGEFWGKMMRGACVVYTYDGDETLYAILKESVEDMLSVQDERGRISTYAPDHEFAGWDLWIRKYVMIGLEYFYDICQDDALKN